MRPSTLLLDALSPAGRRAASSLAARGKDLVLCGEMPSLLEELAAELRVVHSVEVRTCLADLSVMEGVGEVVRWVESHSVAVDGLLLPRWGEADPVRAAQLSKSAQSLRDALHQAFRRAGVEAHLRVVSGVSRPAPSSVPARQRKHTSMMPAILRSEPPRERTVTRKGHSDPSSSEPPG